MKRGKLDKTICKYLGEIGLTIMFVVLSYVGLVNNSLSSYASIASNSVSATTNKDLQVLYGKTDESTEALNENANMLDYGVLTISNPNKSVVTAKVILYINNAENCNGVNVEIAGKVYTIAANNGENDTLSIEAAVYQLEGEESVNVPVIFYANDGAQLTGINYSFEIMQSFY
jgi:hypothetical protein